MRVHKGLDSGYEAAKATVEEFLDRIGCDTVDAGALGEGGRRFQVGTRGYGVLSGPLTDPVGAPASAAAVRAALNS